MVVRRRCTRPSLVTTGENECGEQDAKRGTHGSSCRVPRDVIVLPRHVRNVMPSSPTTNRLTSNRYLMVLQPSE